MAKISRINAGLKWQIRWLIDKHHISDTDEDILKDICKRIDASKFAPAAIKQIKEYALRVHHENQGVYKHFRF